MENLKRLRTEKGMMQKELANKIGTTNSAICNYEKGVREPNIDTLKKLASALDVTVDKLLEEPDEQSRT